MVSFSPESYLMDIRLASLMIISDVWKNEPPGGGGIKRHELTMGTGRADKFLVAARDLFGEQDISFGRLGVRFVAKSAMWDERKNTWNKPNGESIVIVLPTLPSENPALMNGVMAYYSIFPTIFGLQFPTGGANMNTFVWDAGGGGAVIPANNYDLGVANGPFLSFSAVINKLIVRASQDPIFKRKISVNPDMVDSDEEMLRYYEGVDAILKSYFQFENPWALGLGFVFAAANGSEYADPMKKFTVLESKLDVDLMPFNFATHDMKSGGNAPFRRAMVNLDLPARPVSAEDFAAALVDYNCIGPRYPFTCS